MSDLTLCSSLVYLPESIEQFNSRLFLHIYVPLVEDLLECTIRISIH